MHNRLYRLSHGIMTALACLFMVLVFLLNVLYQSEVSYTAHEVTTISGSLKFSLLVLVIWAVLIVAAAFLRGRFPVRSIEEKAVLPADGALCGRRPLPALQHRYRLLPDRAVQHHDRPGDRRRSRHVRRGRAPRDVDHIRRRRHRLLPALCRPYPQGSEPLPHRHLCSRRRLRRQ